MVRLLMFLVLSCVGSGLWAKTEHAVIGFDGKNPVVLDVEYTDAEKMRETVFSATMKRANDGDAFSMFDVGQKHEKKREYIQSVEWYRKAAERGHRPAQYRMGVMYEKGRGVEKDILLAVNWYRKAGEGENGDNRAQHDLYLIYMLGENGVAKDEKEALRWLIMSAEGGNADAQFDLGMEYLVGAIIGRDCHKAVEWWKKSAELKNEKAWYGLSEMYWKNGCGIARDVEEHRKWNALYCASDNRTFREKIECRVEKELGSFFD